MVREIPFEVIATWPPPNYDDPVRRGPGLIALAAVFITLVALLVSLRLYFQIFVLRWFSWDGVFILMAFISACGMTTCTIVAYQHYGWDRHIWDTPTSVFTKSLYIAWWAKTVYSLASCFTRLSLLCFYWRLAEEGSRRRFRICIQILAAMSVIAGVLFVFLTIFQCKPIRAFWTFPPLENQKCLDDGKLTLGCGIANTILDLMVVLLPIPLILGLELPLRQRTGAIVLVSLGLVVCIAGAIRAYYSWFALLKTYDDTWNGFGIYISATVEIDLGVMCACAPSLRAFVNKIVRPRLSGGFLPAPFSSWRSRSKETNSIFGSMSVRDEEIWNEKEMSFGAKRAFRQIRSNAVKRQSPRPPGFNTTKPLPPPPTDAQILRANFRRSNLLKFKPRRVSESMKQKELPQLPQDNFSTIKAMRRRTLTPSIAQIRPQAHVEYSKGPGAVSLESVIDLDASVGSTSTSSVATESIFAASPTSQQPLRTPTSPKQVSGTLRIPASTLKLSRESRPSSPTGSVSTSTRFFQPLSIGGSSTTDVRDWVTLQTSERTDLRPNIQESQVVTKYVIEQHKLLNEVVKDDKITSAD